MLGTLTSSLSAKTGGVGEANEFISPLALDILMPSPTYPILCTVNLGDGQSDCELEEVPLAMRFFQCFDTLYLFRPAGSGTSTCSPIDLVLASFRQPEYSC